MGLNQLGSIFYVLATCFNLNYKPSVLMCLNLKKIYSILDNVTYALWIDFPPHSKIAAAMY